MHDLSETPNFDAAVTVPDDGVDYRTALSLSTKALQQLTNRTRWFKNLLIGAITTPVVINQLSAGSLGAGNTLVDGTLQVNDKTTMYGKLTVSNSITIGPGDATFNAATHLNGPTDAQQISCTSLFTDGFTTIGTNLAQTLDVYATSVFHAPVRCADALTTSALFNVTGTMTLQGIATCINTGRLVRAARIGAQSGGGTLDPGQATCYYFPTVTAAQTYTLSASAAAGDEIEIVSDDGVNNVRVQKPGGVDFSPVMYIGKDYASSVVARYARFKFIAGNWVELYRINGGL